MCLRQNRMLPFLVHESCIEFSSNLSPSLVVSICFSLPHSLPHGYTQRGSELYTLRTFPERTSMENTYCILIRSHIWWSNRAKLDQLNSAHYYITHLLLLIQGSVLVSYCLFIPYFYSSVSFSWHYIFHSFQNSKYWGEAFCYRIRTCPPWMTSCQCLPVTENHLWDPDHETKH